MTGSDNAHILNYVASQQGRSSGLDKGWAILIGAVSLVAAVIGIIFALTRGHT